MVGKDKGRVKLFGGEHLYLFKNGGGGTWLDMGELANDIKLPDVTNIQEIINNAGDSWDILSNRKVNFNAMLLQTGKDEWDFILDESRGNTYMLYYYNGVVGSSYDEFYAPDCMVLPDLTHDTTGKPMTYALKISVRPTSALVTGTPSILPSVKKANANFIGKNKYYARIYTSV